nr:cytochrome b5-like [Tanacetum cinerariifolium]
MSWLRRCEGQQEAAESEDCVEMLVLYCRRSIDKDFRVAGTSEFLKETQEKDNERLRQLEALARETEARARPSTLSSYSPGPSRNAECANCTLLIGKLRGQYQEMTQETKILSFEEVSKHNQKTDCWLILFGKVYDVTKFLDDHPGGEEVLLLTTEKDATEDFEDTGHSKNARDMMKDYYVGELDTNSMPQNNSYTPPSNSTTASKSSKQASGSSSTNMLTFVLPILIFALAYLYYFAKKEVVISHN